MPKSLDAELRRQAREQGKSLNEMALEAMARGLGLAGEPVKQRDLGDVAGTWRRDRATDAALADQRQVDTSLWE